GTRSPTRAAAASPRDQHAGCGSNQRDVRPSRPTLPPARAARSHPGSRRAPCPRTARACSTRANTPEAPPSSRRPRPKDNSESFGRDSGTRRANIPARLRCPAKRGAARVARWTPPVRRRHSARTMPMRARLVSALLVALATSPACIQGAGADGNSPDAGMPAAPKSAPEALTRYVEALGGEALLRGLEQRTVEARVVFVVDQTCEAGDPGCISEETEG